VLGCGRGRPRPRQRAGAAAAAGAAAGASSCCRGWLRVLRKGAAAMVVATRVCARCRLGRWRRCCITLAAAAGGCTGGQGGCAASTTSAAAAAAADSWLGLGGCRLLAAARRPRRSWRRPALLAAARCQGQGRPPPAAGPRHCAQAGAHTQAVCVDVCRPFEAALARHPPHPPSLPACRPHHQHALTRHAPPPPGRCAHTDGARTHAQHGRELLSTRACVCGRAGGRAPCPLVERSGHCGNATHHTAGWPWACIAAAAAGAAPPRSARRCPEQARRPACMHPDQCSE
jgi:hypothetical protein